tara:strand:+ start:4546 stop:6369 length:1824 start_codon:yes stop_codon:yes gene_type:complete
MSATPKTHNKEILRLSKTLFCLAIFLELSIVTLGFGAGYLSGNRSISIPTALLSILAVGEMTALWSTEMLAREMLREQRYLTKLLSLLAVIIAMTFTFFNLGHISMIVESHESSPLEKFLIEKKDHKNIITTNLRHIDKEKSKIQSIKNLSDNQSLILIDKELAQNKYDQTLIESSIKEIINKNYASEIDGQNFLLNANNNKLKELQTQLDQIEERYLDQLTELRKDRFLEIESSNWRQKDKTKQYYENLRLELDEKYKKIKQPKLNEILSLNQEVEKIQELLASYSSMSPASIKAIKAQEDKLTKLTDMKNVLEEKKVKLHETKEDSIVNIEKKISNLQDIVDSNQLSLEHKLREEAEHKKSSWLMKLAANYFKKSTSEVSLSEFKSFSYYFILASCIGLAFLPKILVVLSVLVKSPPKIHIKQKTVNGVVASINSFSRKVEDLTISRRKLFKYVKKIKNTASIKLRDMKKETDEKIFNIKSDADNAIRNKQSEITLLKERLRLVEEKRNNNSQILELKNQIKDIKAQVDFERKRSNEAIAKEYLSKDVNAKSSTTIQNSWKLEKSCLKVQRFKIFNDFLRRAFNLIIVLTAIFTISILVTDFINY